MKVFRFTSVAFLILSTVYSFTAISEEFKPKYGPLKQPIATPISKSHEFFKKANAKDYWAISGYYVPQFNGYSCSAASVAMIVNAARVNFKKSSEEMVVTQAALLDKVQVENWKDRLSDKGFNGDHGVGLEQLAKVTEESFKRFGVEKVKISVVHVEDQSPKTKEKILKDLKLNEESDQNFILANFNQKSYTNDADAGHIAPVGAYDAKTKKVLIFDPDRDYYEPYWISVDAFIDGLATKDSSGKSFRGYLFVSIQK